MAKIAVTEEQRVPLDGQAVFSVPGFICVICMALVVLEFVTLVKSTEKKSIKSYLITS